MHPQQYNAYPGANSRSPPPLQHPIPTHPHYIPEPPDTPVSSGIEPAGYMRFSSEQQRPPPQPQPQPQASFGYSNYQPFVPAGFMSPNSGQGGVPVGGGRGPVPIPPGPNPIPDLNMWGVNDATTQIGMQLGRSAVQAGHEYMEKNFGMFIPMSLLKHHFNVSNSYVLWKLRLLLFPWRHRPWSRKVRRSETSGQPDGWQAPRDDINSPDLYIPSMALVTYVLLATLQAGLDSHFHPDILGLTASKALSVVLVEFLFIKLGCYLLNIQGQGQVTDLVSYGGYKFVAVILALIPGLLKSSGFPFTGRAVSWSVFIYAFLANAFFLLRSLRYMMLPDPAAAPAETRIVTPAQRGRRIQFLFAIAISQVGYMWFLSKV